MCKCGGKMTLLGMGIFSNLSVQALTLAYERVHNHSQNIYIYSLKEKKTKQRELQNQCWLNCVSIWTHDRLLCPDLLFTRQKAMLGFSYYYSSKSFFYTFGVRTCWFLATIIQVSLEQKVCGNNTSFDVWPHALTADREINITSFATLIVI